MMILTLLPQATLGVVPLLDLQRSGDTLYINGEALDLGFLLEGDKLPPGSVDHPLLESATISKVNGVIQVDGILFQIDPRVQVRESCFPEPIHVQGDGPITTPAQINEEAVNVHDNQD